MSLVQFNSYLSLTITSGVSTARLAGGAIVEGFTSDNGGEFSLLYRYEDGTAASQKIVAMTDEGIETFVGHDTFNLRGLVVALTGGGFATVVNCDGTDIFARVFDAHGNPVSDYIRVTDSSADRYLTSATATSDGGFTVNWSDNSNGSQLLDYGNGDPNDFRDYDNWARHYSAAGMPGGAASLAQDSDNANLAKSQRNGDCVGLTNGTTAHVFTDEHRVWNDAHSAYGYNTSVSLSINGGAEIKVNDDFDSKTSNPVVMSAGTKIVQLSNGNIAVAWLEDAVDDETWHARIYDTSGNAITDDTTLFSFAGFSNGSYAMTAMEAGKFALLCTVRDADGTNGVRLGVFDSHGVLLDQGIVSAASGHQVVSDLSYLGDGGLLVTYTDQNDPNFASRSTVIVQPGSGQVGISGNGNAQTFNGGSKADWIDGKAGKDTINGAGNDDHLFGGLGDDHMNGALGNDSLFGQGGEDRLDGGTGNNVFEGGADADLLILGSGVDTLVYGTADDSKGRNFDTVDGFDFAADRFDLKIAVTAIDAAVTTGTLSKKNFTSDLSSALDDAHLGANHAVLFQPDHGVYGGDTFLAIDINGVAGFQVGQDMIVQLDSAANLASIAIGDFV